MDCSLGANKEEYNILLYYVHWKINIGEHIVIVHFFLLRVEALDPGLGDFEPLDDTGFICWLLYLGGGPAIDMGSYTEF